jgi:ERCC4-type nuclease
MEQVQIIVDDREQKVIPYFNEFVTPPNIGYKVVRVNIGDYNVIYKGNIIMSIERKTWKDLAGSIKDGRKDNVNKMIKLREEVGCQLFYLIEGHPLPNPTAKCGRISYKNLCSHLDHLMVRDNIHIIHSKDKKNTVERLFQLVQNYLTIKPSMLLKYGKEETKGGVSKDGDGIAKLKEKIIVTAESIIYKIWCCVPNITEKTSSLFINQGYHIADLILGNITKEQIYAMKYDNGYVIGARSNKIWNGSRIKSTNDKYFAKMLSHAPGITKKTAEVILSSISFEDLLKGDIELNTLASIQKTAKTKVGICAGKNVLKYFGPVVVLVPV